MREQDDTEPAHHARRPMNAFLIFCKRHRSVVRDKYPNLENRSITKILGEWWANLDKEEKSCYTGLAKQYKDAFFNANPDFKWYKLPAPPLRTLSSRPREPHDKPEHHHLDDHDEELEKINNNSTQVDFNTKQNIFDEPKLSMFTPGKLADEAHMGGLSSLLATKTESQTLNPYYSPHAYKINPISTHIDNEKLSKNRSKEENIRELQNALSETTRMFEDLDDAKCKFQNAPLANDNITNQDVINQIVDKRFSKEDEYQKWSDDEKSRSGRSCKGKRYQEFMAVGKLIVNKRQKREHERSPEDGYLASCSWEQGSNSRSDESITDDSKNSPTNETYQDADVKMDQIDMNEAENSSKAFKAADFDLDAKIKALPSLSLEKFQQKKRENKRKKKTVNLKPKMLEPRYSPKPFYAPERREFVDSWRENMIGSQKRKPRKISITRLEINSLVSSTDLKIISKTSPEIKLATEAPRTVQSMDMCKEPAHTNIDLLALATLAEVASNTSKIEDTKINEAVTETVTASTIM